MKKNFLSNPSGKVNDFSFVLKVSIPLQRYLSILFAWVSTEVVTVLLYLK